MDTDHEHGDSTQHIPINKNKQRDETKDDTSSEDEETSEMSKEFDEIVSSTPAETQDVKQSVQPQEPKTLQEPQKSPAQAPTTPSKLNKYFLYTLVGGLVISALISVFAVLAGEFTSVMSRALETTLSMASHTLLILFLVSVNARQRSKTRELLINGLMIIIVASFITSTLGIWGGVFTGRSIADMYLLYIYSFCALLWTYLLLNIGENLLDKATRILSLVSVGFTAVFYLLLLPTIFTHYPYSLPEFYYRSMAATVIFLATSSVLTVVFHRIYISKHPEIKPSTKEPAWDIIVACIALFVGALIIFALMATLSAHNSYDTSRNVDTVTQTSEPKTTPSVQSTSPWPRHSTTYDNDTVTDCSRLAAFQKPRVLQYVSTYIFLSHNPAQKQITSAWSDNGAIMSPVSYQGTLTAVDANCRSIDVDTLKSGDNVKFYLRVGYSNFYRDALVFVQKLD